MLTMDMLLWDIRDRIIYQRLQNKVLPAHQAALLFDRKEMLRGNRFYIGHWRDLPPTAPLGCVTSVFFCVMEEGMVLEEEPDATYRNLILFSGTAVSLHNHIVSRLQAYNEWLEGLRSEEDLQKLTEQTAEKTIILREEDPAARVNEEDLLLTSCKKSGVFCVIIVKSQQHL